MTPPRPIAGWLKALLEYGPIALFFGVFMLFRDREVVIAGQGYDGVLLATLVFVPVTVVASALMWRLTGRLSVAQMVTLVVVVIFGGISIWLNDPQFIKMKPTLIYAIFAGMLGFSWLTQRDWLARVMGDALSMRPEGWRILTLRLALMFAALAIVNELVWRTMSDTFWVNFKTFGLPLVICAFLAGNAGLFQRYGTDSKD